MERFIKWSGIIIITIALVLCGLYWSQRPIPYKDDISISDQAYVIMALRAKSAVDCVLTPISENVWACKEWKSGKVFMVRR